MSLSLSQSQLNALARYGVTARIQELEAEISAIRAAFPKTNGSGQGRKASRQVATAAGASATRKRRHMSAAARKAVSLRMRKYWAAKRKAAAK